MAVTKAIDDSKLTPREQRLKRLLLDVAAFIDKSGDAEDPETERAVSGETTVAEPLVLRWAGGWVRDRLLGEESHDIDTAINSMTGFAFAEKMKAFCSDAANTERHQMSPADIGNLHKVEANPDKSKHLETATVRIFDMDVDFVNLRKEEYASDSRNPQMEFGTAEEDASRRDATVNALFYNLNTGLVEDFTGGLADMEAKRIRTPLEPLQTFTDDPLRVLRLVRFASRLEFTIDPEVEKYMADPRVLDSLRIKISRERVGTELEKMLKGKHPRDALELIDRLGLYSTIFTDPSQTDLPEVDLTGWKTTYECLHHMAETRTPGSIYDTLVRTEEARYFAWILASVTPWEAVPERSSPEAAAPPPPAAPAPTTGKKGGNKGANKGAAVKKKPPPMVVLSIREGIRAPNKLCDVVLGSHQHREEIVSLKQAVCDKAPYIHECDRFGMAIRAWEARGSNWKLQVLFALLFDVLQTAQKHKDGVLSEKERDALLGGWQQFLDHLEELDVQDAPHIKRLLDGTQVAKALGIKPGRWMTAAMDICMAWQLRNPNETDPAGAIEAVREHKEELGIANQLK